MSGFDYYTPLRETLPPLELEAVIPNRITRTRHRVCGSMRHLRYHEFMGLNDLLIGEIQPIADPTGRAELKVKRRKLGAVLERLSNLNPDIYPGGEIRDRAEIEKWVEADENADAVWALWTVYEREIENPSLKSEATGSSHESSADAGAVEKAAPDARVPAVSRIRAVGEGAGGSVSGAESAGAIS